MNIGIIGAGSIGATLARLFAEAGHQVAISNSRDPESLADVIRELGTNIKAMTVDDAASFGDLVIEAIPFGRYQTLPVEQLAGKILISAANYYPRRDGQIELRGRAQSELIAEHLPKTKVVKAFNSIWYQHLGSQGNPALPVGERRVIFVAGEVDPTMQPGRNCPKGVTPIRRPAYGPGSAVGYPGRCIAFQATVL